MTGRLRFRPPWWAFALAAAGCVAGVLLGNWQAGRAAEKRALAAAQKPETLRGDLLEKYTLFLDNRTHRGVAGYDVLQPLRLRDGRQVLVNRGWVQAAATRAQLPAVRTPAGEVALQGLRVDHLPRAFEPAGATREGRVWQNASVDEVAAWSGLRLEPWVLEQHAGPEDGLVREWPRADEGVGMHESYALQWYSLAALSVVLLVALNLKRETSAS
jgi:surfeit locus 1 family protein